MAYYLAPSLVNLRSEVNRRWPKRSKSSDGWLGDTAHKNRKSEHNPDSKGCVHAIDITAQGIDPRVLISSAIKHPSTWYVIYNGVIYSRTYGFKPKKYTGSNPHKTHIHVSIELTTAAEKSKVRWLSAKKPTTAPRPRVPAYPGSAEFQVGDRGTHIKVVQLAVGNNPTGVMGVSDLKKVKAFQRVRPGLWPADGKVGPKTYAALAASPKVKARFRP
jgi:hypothetical protein